MKACMPVTIQVIPKALFKIFKNDFAFTVPLYPGPYTWTAHQAGELLADLLAALENDSQPVLFTRPYFLGSIALIKGEGAPDVNVVDGRRRLTEFAILLAALRRLLPNQFSAMLAVCKYEKGDLIAGMSDRYRPKLREGDEEFFRYFIQDEKEPQSPVQFDSQLTENQRNVLDHINFFIEALSRLPELRCQRLLQYLMLRCFLVAVSAPDIESAYHTFSVLNARTQDLRLIDLVRSEMIGSLPGEKQGSYIKFWEDEEEETFQELFAHIRLVYRKTKLRDVALLEYRKHIPPQKNPQKFIDDVLRPYSESLEIIRTASYSSDQDAGTINSMLGWLNQIDNFDWVPPAILYLAQNRDARGKLERFFTDLERLAAGLMILRADAYSRIRRYERLLSAVEENAELDAANSPLQLTSGEISLITKILAGDLYLARRIRRYVLLRLDSALAGGRILNEDPVISAEHVLPQSPDKESIWMKWFPTADERVQRVHRIGNLVLLAGGKSVQAQNFDFEKMKNYYFAAGRGASPFILTAQVLQHREWTPAAIDERQKQLVNKLKILWRL